jgi:hypothetical protein
LNWRRPAKKGRRWRVLAALVLVATGEVLAQGGRANAAGPPPYNDGSLLYNGWNPVGGMAQGTPAVTTWDGGRLDVFVRGGDNHLWHKAYSGSWSPWQNLGAPPGGLTSDPAAVAWSAGRLDVFVAGAGGQVWHTAYVGWWTAWQPLGGIAVGAPAVSSWAAGRLDVFVRGSDNQLWHKYYSGVWSAWQPPAGDSGSGITLTAPPAAVSWGPNRIDVFVRDTQMSVFHFIYDNGAWFDEYLGGNLAYGPGVTSWGSGRLDLYAVGPNHRLYHQWYVEPVPPRPQEDVGGGWTGWQLALPSNLTSAPAPVSTAVEHIDVFGRGADLGVWQSIGALPASQCSASKLSISLGRLMVDVSYDQLMYFVHLPVYFVNTSSTACYLTGPPDGSTLDSAGNTIGAPPGRGGPPDYGPVPLAPGGTAQAWVRWQNLPPGTCPLQVPAEISIIPPGGTTTTVLPLPSGPYELMVCPAAAGEGNWGLSPVFSPALDPLPN